MKPRGGIAAFTLIETMMLVALFIIVSLAVGSSLFKQKQGQISSQQVLTGRKVLTEAISKLNASTWEYPVFIVSNSAMDASDVGITGLTSRLTLSYVTCYDRTGTPMANTNGDMRHVAVAVDNRAITGSSSCARTGSFMGTGFQLPAEAGGSRSPCGTYSINSTFKLSGLCAAPAEYEVQVTPQVERGQGWNGVYDVWVVSVLSDEQKKQKGIIRHYFREEVVIEQ